MTQDLVPFRQFILKVHSRCDLACDHCYVYEHTDQSWRGRPKDGITGRTAASAAERIAEHAATHGLSDVHVILHGGEPLLLGVPRSREVLDILRRTIGPVTNLVLRMHTNGVLLSEEFLDLLAEYDVRIGVSLDGGRAANDLHRVDRRGQSSYDHVIAALDLLRRPAYRHLYSGLLCTIDLQNDPVEAYRALLAQEPPRIDFLLPHATWEHQPFGLDARRDPARAKDGTAPYAAWLGRIFTAWDETGRPVPIRTFDSVLAALHGRPSGTESLGLVPADLVVIETDGTLEQADWLKTTYEGAAATGFDVFTNTLDQAATHAGIMARQHGLNDLCDTCRTCPVVEVCGGGLYAHRYDPATGFTNPSVYCPDLSGLIMRVSRAEGISVPTPAEGAQESSASDAAYAHNLTPADFASVAAGHGTASAIRTLTYGQLSIRRELLAVLAGAGPQDDRLFTGAWDRLAGLDEEYPQAVDRVLAQPFVRQWAVRCLEQSEANQGGDGAARLAAIAVSANLLAATKTSLAVPVYDGIVHLPGFGSLRSPDGAAELPATEFTELSIETLADHRVIVSGGGVTREIDLTAEGADPFWEPVRRLEADGMSVTLEDLDPYRDCHAAPVPRLSAADVERWQAVFSQAIAYLDKCLPHHATALRAGLTTVVPLLIPADGGLRSEAARHAFGAVAATLTEDPAMLALLLVRGFQQAKLGALLDHDDYYTAADAEPILAEAYLNLAECEFWRARRHDASGAEADAAQARFVAIRAHITENVSALLGSESLTPLGERFVRGMAETVSPWLTDEADEAEAAAESPGIGPAATIAPQRSTTEQPIAEQPTAAAEADR